MGPFRTKTTKTNTQQRQTRKFSYKQILIFQEKLTKKKKRKVIKEKSKQMGDFIQHFCCYYIAIADEDN